MTEIYAFLTQVWEMWEVQFAVYHIAFNLLMACAGAIKTGEFELQRLSNFLYKKLLKNLVIFVAVKLFGGALGYDHIAILAWGLVEMELLADLALSLKQLGLPIPEKLMQYIKREVSDG